ncbi:MAG TPA: hypothetical protein PLL89_01390 [bacterium]|nr:hypothetical protein [bacterium]
MDRKWWEKPVRMIRRDYLNDFACFFNADMDKLAWEARYLWKANCEWIMATPGCSPGTGHLTLFNSDRFEKFPGTGSRDILREYLPYARRHKIHIIAYINMHWYSYDFASQHPSWEQLLEDGTPYGRKHPLYGNGTTFCVNSPWREWAFDMIQEVMKTGVDGCFLDGPVIYPGACYCKYCREKFKMFSGENMLPIFSDWKDPLWKKFAEFRSQSWADFMKDATNAAKNVNSEAVMFLNGGAFNSSNILLGYDAERIEKFQSFTGAEDFFHCTQAYHSPYTSLNLSRFLSAGKNPSVVFTHHALSTWHYVPLPEAEVSTALAQATAGGSNTWFAIFYLAIKNSKSDAIVGVKKTGGLIAKNEKYLEGSVSAAETGVLISNRTLYYYISKHSGLCRETGSGKEQGLIFDTGSDEYLKDIDKRREISCGILDNENRGCLDICNFAHIPVQVLWDGYILKENLHRIKTLILPNAACLSDLQVKNIMDFVYEGGILFSDFESGMYDEYGNDTDRNDWLRFIGIDRISGVFKPSRVEDYIVLTKKVGSFDSGFFVPRPVNALAIKPVKEASILANYLNPINMPYTQPKGISEFPAIITTKRGKGKIVYLASPMFESFNLFHIDTHKNLFYYLIRDTVPGGSQIETNAPGSLALEIRRTDKTLLIHLVNITSDMKRPMGTIVPLYNISISIRTDLKNARSLSSGKTIKLKKIKGRTTFVIPEVNEYEIVLLY